MSSQIDKILARARDEQLFSGAAWSYGNANGVLDSGMVGTVAWEGATVGTDTWWDLASVTKPIVGLAVMSLVESGELLLDDTIAQHLPDYVGTDKAALTVRQLLCHTSGIPGQLPMYHWCPTRDQLLDGIRELPLRFAPGTDVAYSSQGFVVLGLVAEAAAGITLDRLVAERVTGPAGMGRTVFGLPEHLRHKAAATEACPWRGKLVQGTVHDENADVLGGIAGHAGLFAPLTDLDLLGQALCRGGAGAAGRILAPPTLSAMIAPATDELPLRRCLAWQGRDTHDCPAGDLMGRRAYGHTGFTGTSIWVDPELGIYVVLLTNRVHPSRSERGFTRVRRVVHNMAVRDSATT